MQAVIVTLMILGVLAMAREFFTSWQHRKAFGHYRGECITNEYVRDRCLKDQAQAKLAELKRLRGEIS